MLCAVQDFDYLISLDSWELLEKEVDRSTVLKIVEERLHRYPRTREDGGSTQYVVVGGDDCLYTSIIPVA